jgi:hypothetical protein
MRLKVLFIGGLFSLLSCVASAAGYIEKDSYLYPIMIDIRHKDYVAAMAKLEPYVEQKDPAALFWYGYMKQQNFGRDRFLAYHWFEKSIAKGNPYSMYKLSGEGSTEDICEGNGWHCSEENLTKAIEGWKELATKGDAKAEYLYKFYDRSLLEMGIDTWFSDFDDEIMLEAAQKGYYLPLIRRANALSTTEHDRDFWGDELYQFIIDNADKDPALATYRAAHVYEGLSLDERINLLTNSLKKGYYPAGYEILNLALEGKYTSCEKAYKYARVSLLGKYSRGGSHYLIEDGLVSEKKIPELDRQAQEFFDNIEHVINFDEMDFMFMFKPDV